MTGVDWGIIKENIMMARSVKGQEKMIVLPKEDWYKIRDFIGEMIDMRQRIREFLE